MLLIYLNVENLYQRINISYNWNSNKSYLKKKKVMIFELIYIMKMILIAFPEAEGNNMNKIDWNSSLLFITRQFIYKNNVDWINFCY